MSTSLTEDLATSNARLQEQLDAAKTALAAATEPTKPKKPNPLALVVGKVSRGIWAAVASTQAVKQEKSLVALIAVRLLVSAGAADALVKLVQEILRSQGWSS